MPLDLLDELKLLVLQNGIPPQVIAGAINIGEDLALLIRTGVDRNRAEEVAAKVRAARDLHELAQSPGLAEHVEVISNMVTSLLADVDGILSEDADEDDAAGEDPPPLAAA